VERLWAATERGEPGPEIEPAPHAVLVWRRDERVLHRAADPLEGECLAAALAGEAFGALCERIAAPQGDEAAPSVAAGLLAGWLDAGLVASALPGGEPE
jgi:hypothetical protein